jgi:hypothetical protein
VPQYPVVPDGFSPLQNDAWAVSLSLRPRRVEQADSPLFHYTSAAAFESVVKNGSLWLSNAAYLNDAEELTYPAELARSVLAEFLLSESDPGATRFMQEVTGGLFAHILFKSWFVGSLTTRGNQLSQWRAYWPSGGYSMGFLGSDLAKRVQTAEHVWLRPIVYERDDQVARLRRVIAIHIDIWRDLRAHHAEVPQDTYDAELASTLGLALSEEFIFFKRDVFVEEQEWRLARYRMEAEHPNFYERRGVLTPYLSFELADEGTALPLHTVITAPLGDHVLAEYSAKLLLKSKGYNAEQLLTRPGYRLRP